MKKIMFNDKYGLTNAVLNGDKTMTRRIIKAPRRTIEGKEVCGFAINKTSDGVPYEVWLTGPDEESLCQLLPTYKVGEIVAVAQKYLDLRNCYAFYEALEKADPTFPLECIEGEKGCYNKMFVKAEWMPHRIRITGIKVERLQDISDEYCMKEGVFFFNCGIDYGFTVHGMKEKYGTAREAFAALIDKVSGKGTWENNPYCFCYEFKLVK